LLRTNIVLLSTTLMFMACNIGIGILNVALPIFSDQIAGGGPGVYGTLLGILSAGEVLSASLAGSLVLSLSLGRRIALAQVLSTAGLLVLLVGPIFLPTAIGLFAFGFFTAPLTIWAQTLRMQVIPAGLRGRTFSLLRTLMQGTTPVGGALGGFLLPVFGIPLMILFSALLIGIPGLAGLRIPGLRQAGGD
jgi:MFS family permease